MELNPIHTFKPKMKVAIDFDGTICYHEFPNVGHKIGAIPVLKLLNKAGARLILDTMRSNGVLTIATNWLTEEGVEFYSIGKDKGQHRWTSANKCHADICIDDRNIGCPLLVHHAVNWVALMHSLFSFFISNGITIEEWNDTMKQVKKEQAEFLEWLSEQDKINFEEK